MEEAALAASCTALDLAEWGTGSGFEVDDHVAAGMHEAVVGSGESPI